MTAMPTHAVSDWDYTAYRGAIDTNYIWQSSFDWLEAKNDVKQFGYIEAPQRRYIAPHITQRMQEPFRGNKFRLGGQKT